jgi:hypothetical protein
MDLKGNSFLHLTKTGKMVKSVSYEKLCMYNTTSKKPLNKVIQRYTH